jgi:hypothetical protein
MKTFAHSVALSAMTNIDQRRTTLIDSMDTKAIVAWPSHDAELRSIY